MSIAIDTTQPVRRPADLVRLVEAVRVAGAADEAHWVEWKGTLPLDRAEGWFSISKQILGFANRHPDSAARFMGGLGYVIVGLEPGAVPGITPVDGAKLDDWLRVFLGNDGPIWSPSYVTVDGANVLIIIVEPPNWGDRIFVMRKTYQPSKGAGADKGTVFIRREANTERANDAEMDMLQDRLIRGLRQPGLELELGWKDEPVALTPVAVGADDRRRWVEARREVLLRSLQEHKPPQPPTRRAAPGRSSQSLANALLMAARAEDRSPDLYRREVEKHLREADDRLAAVTADRLARAGINTVRLVARNTSDRNLPKVKVVLYIPGRVTAIDIEDLDDDPRGPELPAPPRRYGTLRPPTALSGFAFPNAGLSYLNTSMIPRSIRPLGLEIDNGGSARLTFHIGDLRPREQAELEIFSVMVAEPPGVTITASWHATSTGVDGVQEGTLTFSTTEHALTPLDFVPYEDEPVDDEEPEP